MLTLSCTNKWTLLGVLEMYPEASAKGNAFYYQNIWKSYPLSVFTALFWVLTLPSWLKTSEKTTQLGHLYWGEISAMCEDKASYLGVSVAYPWHTCTPLAQSLSANRAEASMQLRPGLVSDSSEELKWTMQTLIPPPFPVFY